MYGRIILKKKLLTFTSIIYEQAGITKELHFRMPTLLGSLPLQHWDRKTGRRRQDRASVRFTPKHKDNSGPNNKTFKIAFKILR